jgi:hypothetical protein
VTSPYTTLVQETKEITVKRTGNSQSSLWCTITLGISASIEAKGKSPSGGMVRAITALKISRVLDVFSAFRIPLLLERKIHTKLRVTNTTVAHWALNSSE